MSIWYVVPGRDAEGRGLLVEVDGAFEIFVQATDVERKLVVHEDPEIVVAAEREDLTGLVLEGDVDLGREVVVVALAGGVTEALTVEREEGVAVVDEDARLTLRSAGGRA